MAEIDGRNYARNTIRALARINQPFIIRGNYYAPNDYENIDYITYTDIRPYVPQGANTTQICNHLNVMKTDVDKYIAVRPEATYQRDILVCRARIYEDSNGVPRGGIYLTEELGIPPVIRANYEKCRAIIDMVPKNRYVDFFSFAEGRYAYYGKNLWKDGHKQAPVKTGQDEKRKLRKEKKKNTPARSQPPMSAEEFIKLYDKLNPLWIPPPTDFSHLDHAFFIRNYVPQKELREMLFGWPSLKKDVMALFARRM